MTDAPYYTTGCRHCEWRTTAAAFELPDLRTLKGQPPARLAEFHAKLSGHIQRCAQDEEAQIAKLERTRVKRTRAGQAPPAPLDLAVCKHHLAAVQVANRILLAQSTAILECFTTNDPALAALHDSGRYALQQVTRRFAFTDQMLSDRLQPLGLEPDLEQAIFAIVSEIRDALEERGNYSPGQPGAAVAVETATLARNNAGTAD